MELRFIGDFEREVVEIGDLRAMGWLTVRGTLEVRSLVVVTPLPACLGEVRVICNLPLALSGRPVWTGLVLDIEWLPVFLVALMRRVRRFSIFLLSPGDALLLFRAYALCTINLFLKKVKEDCSFRNKTECTHPRVPSAFGVETRACAHNKREKKEESYIVESIFSIAAFCAG